MSRKSVERVELEKSKKRVMFMGGTGNKSKRGAICHARSALAACTAEAAVTCTVTQSLGGHSRSDRPVPARVSHTGRAGASWPSPPHPATGAVTSGRPCSWGQNASRNCKEVIGGRVTAAPFCPRCAGAGESNGSSQVESASPVVSCGPRAEMISHL